MQTQNIPYTLCGSRGESASLIAILELQLSGAKELLRGGQRWCESQVKTKSKISESVGSVEFEGPAVEAPKDSLAPVVAGPVSVLPIPMPHLSPSEPTVSVPC